MKKFRDYIYCDDERLSSYIGQIEELNKNVVSASYEKETSVDGGFNVAAVKAGTNLTERTSSDYKINVSNHERFIDWVYSNGNANIYTGGRLDDNNRDEIISLRGKITIPELSGNIEAINMLTKNNTLFDVVSISDEDKKIISYMKESNHIPLLLEMDSDYIVSCNLNREYLKVSTDDFYDNIDMEVNLIGKIERVYNDDSNVEIFDLAKEIFKFNRALRRTLPEEGLKKSMIVEKGPLVKITPIIIYK